MRWCFSGCADLGLLPVLIVPAGCPGDLMILVVAPLEEKASGSKGGSPGRLGAEIRRNCCCVPLLGARASCTAFCNRTPCDCGRCRCGGRCGRWPGEAAQGEATTTALSATAPGVKTTWLPSTNWPPPVPTPAGGEGLRCSALRGRALLASRSQLLLASPPLLLAPPGGPSRALCGRVDLCRLSPLTPSAAAPLTRRGVVLVLVLALAVGGKGAACSQGGASA